MDFVQKSNGNIALYSRISKYDFNESYT